MLVLGCLPVCKGSKQMAPLRGAIEYDYFTLISMKGREVALKQPDVSCPSPGTRQQYYAEQVKMMVNDGETKIRLFLRWLKTTTINHTSKSDDTQSVNQTF